MPTYVYQVVTEDGTGEVFEVVQSMKDDPLTIHPESGAPVQRIPQAPMIGGRHSTTREKTMLSDGNLDRLGFTKYVKTGDGSYDKTAGSGPSSLNAD